MNITFVTSAETDAEMRYLSIWACRLSKLRIRVIVAKSMIAKSALQAVRQRTLPLVPRSYVSLICVYLS